MHPIEVAWGVHGEVFGRQPIGNVAGFFIRSGDNRKSISIKSLARNRIRAAALLGLGDHSFCQILARGDEDGESFRIVFGLCRQVGSNIGCGAALARDHNLSGAGQHVDGAIKGHQAVGRGHVKIAGPNDLVDAPKARGAVCQRGYGVRAAEAIKLRDTEQVGGGQGCIRGFGRDNHDAMNARNLGWNHGHQQRGWQRMTAARHVASHRAKRAHELAGGEARIRRIIP